MRNINPSLLPQRESARCLAICDIIIQIWPLLSRCMVRDTGSPGFGVFFQETLQSMCDQVLQTTGNGLLSYQSETNEHHETPYKVTETAFDVHTT
jgi:hypothetical protein